MARSNRAGRARTAEETVAILESGSYRTADGVIVDIEHDLAAAVAGTRLYEPDDLTDLRQGVEAVDSHDTPPHIEVRNCTTFAAARFLSAGAAHHDPLCLNFASARNPGGGFLGGSQAQEEALARASGLYACVRSQPMYYARNRRHGSALYTDHMIYSPRVPVFRDDEDRLLEEPYSVSILTAPAVNAGAVRANEPEAAGEIAPTMHRRIRNVLAVARAHRHEQLVLGAWGCGVVANDPAEVSELFRAALEEPRFGAAFRTVVFAVLDHSTSLDTFDAFERAFAE